MAPELSHTACIFERGATPRPTCFERKIDDLTLAYVDEQNISKEKVEADRELYDQLFTEMTKNERYCSKYMDIVSQRLDPTVMQMFTGRWHQFHHWNLLSSVQIQMRQHDLDSESQQSEKAANERLEVSCKEVAGICEAVELAYSDDYEDMDESAQFSIEWTDDEGEPYLATYWFPNDLEDNPRNSFRSGERIRALDGLPQLLVCDSKCKPPKLCVTLIQIDVGNEDWRTKQVVVMVNPVRPMGELVAKQLSALVTASRDLEIHEETTRHGLQSILKVSGLITGFSALRDLEDEVDYQYESE